MNYPSQLCISINNCNEFSRLKSAKSEDEVQIDDPPSTNIVDKDKGSEMTEETSGEQLGESDEAVKDGKEDSKNDAKKETGTKRRTIFECFQPFIYYQKAWIKQSVPVFINASGASSLRSWIRALKVKNLLI